jgi:hypothetical protein
VIVLLRRKCSSRLGQLSHIPPNGWVQPYHEFLVRWSEADVSAVAYAVAHAGSRRPEHAFLAGQLRIVAERWQKGLDLEVRHMQQRMPR